MRYEVPQLRGPVKYIEDMERSGFNRGAFSLELIYLRNLRNLRTPLSFACPVYPVAPEDGTGVKYLPYGIRVANLL